MNKKDMIINIILVATIFLVILITTILVSVKPAAAIETSLQYKDGYFLSRVYPVNGYTINGDMNNIERYGKDAEVMGYIIDEWFWLPSGSWRPIDIQLYLHQTQGLPIIKAKTTNQYPIQPVEKKPKVKIKKHHKKVKRCKYCHCKNGKHKKNCGYKYKTDFVV